MNRPVVVLLGKLPPPFMGPAIATRILLDSSLNVHFRLVHLDTRAHRSLQEMGRFSFAKLFRTLFIYARMKWFMVRYLPDLVIVPISQSAPGFFKDSLYVIIARCFGRKVLLHLRGSDFRNRYEKSGAIVRWYIRSICRISFGVIVQGERLRSVFNGLFPDYRIFVVPNGADYVVPARSRSAEDTIPRILYLANLQSSKGILDLLEAITILQNRIKTPFSVDVVGDWRDTETKRTATEIVERFGSPVRFHPPAVADAKMQYMADADIFVFPPRAPEGHPWVIVEAQAAGLPIVATPQGAIPEAVEDGKCGFIVPAADPAAIAEKLERLILDATMRRVFGDRSLAIYHDRYTEAAMVDRFASVIRAAIGGTVHTK